MFNPHENHETMSRPDATRPPQLNQTVCGCRCGRGAGAVQESEHDGDGGDGLSTAVASADSEMDDHISYSGDTELNTNVEGPMSDPVPAEHLEYLRARIEQFINTTEGFLHPTEFELPSLFSDQNATTFRDYDMDSMRPEPSSDGHSVVAPDTRPIRSISPGPGIGYWTREDDYHFLARPLRLTPQHQYCRGLVASHLVMRDQEVRGMARGNGFQVDDHLQEI